MSFISNLDTSRITYSGTWTTQFSGGSLEGTVHTTNEGDASFSFNANGPEIQVFGSIPVCPSSGSQAIAYMVVVDGVIVNGEIASKPCLNTTQNHVVLYGSHSLSTGSHNVVILNSPSSLHGFPLQFDYAEVTFTSTTANVPTPTTSRIGQAAPGVTTNNSPNSGPVSLSATSLNSPTNSGPVSLSATSLNSSTLISDSILPTASTLTNIPGVSPSVGSSGRPTGSSSSTTATPVGPAGNSLNVTSPSKSILLGPIVGGAIGAVLILAILWFLIFWLRGRRKSKTPYVRGSETNIATNLEAVNAFPISTTSLDPLSLTGKSLSPHTPASNQSTSTFNNPEKEFLLLGAVPGSSTSASSDPVPSLSVDASQDSLLVQPTASSSRIPAPSASLPLSLQSPQNLDFDLPPSYESVNGN